MALGAFIAVCEMMYKRHKRLQYEATRKPTAGARSEEPPTRVFAMPAATPYVIVRRDGAVWAGPWKNDGRSFTRVPKNWWIFRSKEKAERELESNNFLTGCTIEEAE